jgi:Zinc finger domain/CCCH-type zinc finger
MSISGAAMIGEESVEKVQAPDFCVGVKAEYLISKEVSQAARASAVALKAELKEKELERLFQKALEKSNENAKGGEDLSRDEATLTEEQSAPPAEAPVLSRKQMCRNFQAGRCTRGAACKFSHEEGAVDDSDFVVSKTKDTKAPSDGKSNRKRVRERDSVQKEDKLCPSVSQDKECKYGDACTFTHDAIAFLSKKPADLGKSLLGLPRTCLFCAYRSPLARHNCIRAKMRPVRRIRDLPEWFELFVR